MFWLLITLGFVGFLLLFFGAVNLFFYIMNMNRK